jgi:MFS family permease
VNPRAGALRAYVAGVALWSAATGMQSVLFSWLVVGELGAAPEVVGLVQMAHVAPLLVLLLVGGAAADRLDRRRLLVGLCATAGALAAALSAAVALSVLELPLLVAYAVAIGSTTAFVLPARDALLSEVSRGDLMRGATALTITQVGAQALGTLVAGSARYLGLAPAIGIQALLMALGIAAALRLPAAPPREGPPPERLRASDWLAGLAEVARVPALRGTLSLMAGVGLFLAGNYFVVVPILIRDHYAGGVLELSLFMGSLQIGTVLGAALLLMTTGRLARRGRALAASLAASALPMLALSRAMPFAAALAASFVWGLCAASFQSLGRALVQEHAPDAQRARVLAVYSLSMTGAGVLGQPFAGLLAGWLGPRLALAVGGAALLAFVAAVGAATKVTRIE